MTAAAPIGTVGGMEPTPFAKAAKALRKQLGLTTEQVAANARATGDPELERFARQDVERIESGERKVTTTRNRKGAAAGLGTSPEIIDAVAAGTMTVAEAARRTGMATEPRVDRTEVEPPPPESPEGVDTEPLVRAIGHALYLGKGKWTSAEAKRAEAYVRAGHRSIPDASEERLVEIATDLLRAIHAIGVKATDADIGWRLAYGKDGPPKK